MTCFFKYTVNHVQTGQMFFFPRCTKTWVWDEITEQCSLFFPYWMDGTASSVWRPLCHTWWMNWVLGWNTLCLQSSSISKLRHSHWAAPTHDPAPSVRREDPHSFPPHRISARRSGRPSSWASRRSSPRGRGSWAVWKPHWSSWLPRHSLHRCSNTEHITGRRNQKVKDEWNTSGFTRSLCWILACVMC